MKYFFKSVLTASFWRYALVSREALANIFAVMGVLYAFMEMLDFFGIYTKDIPISVQGRGICNSIYRAHVRPVHSAR